MFICRHIMAPKCSHGSANGPFTPKKICSQPSGWTAKIGCGTSSGYRGRGGKGAMPAPLPRKIGHKDGYWMRRLIFHVPFPPPNFLDPLLGTHCFQQPPNYTLGVNETYSGTAIRNVQFPIVICAHPLCNK